MFLHLRSRRVGQIRPEYVAFYYNFPDGLFSLHGRGKYRTVGSTISSMPVLPQNSPICVEMILQGEARFGDYKKITDKQNTSG